MPYDPRSSRPTPKVAPDEESAPIDALLGPSPTSDELVEDPAAPAVGQEARTPLPVPVRRAARAPSPVLQLAPLLIAFALLVLWLVRRKRR
jgi:hypothetical protein